MRLWVNGDLGDEFEQGLDALLAELSPGRQPPELPEPYREHLEFVEHHRRALKRTQVGSRLKKPLGETIVESVLDVITLDEDVTDNKQLTREWLARGFLLEPSHFPPNLHALVAPRTSDR